VIHRGNEDYSHSYTVELVKETENLIGRLKVRLKRPARAKSEMLENYYELKKHGIDFYITRELWKDPDMIEIKALSEDEPRYLVIGRIMTKQWSAVITYRSENIRLISGRRSRKKEAELYES
jgi:hypothetical protein